MTKIISFSVTGAFASFRDPSVTTNQTVYYIPSKTAVVGILGAILGIGRTDTLGDIYSKEYLEFFSKLKIGICLENNPRKITYFTNHRSLKASKTKPVKKEILVEPKYTIFVASSDEMLDQISDVIKHNRYQFSPYLGHAYCPAKITDLQEHEGKQVERLSGVETDCVVLDETETYDGNFKILIKTKLDEGSIIVERHLHHFFEKDTFQKRVLKHWIPLESTICTIKNLQENKLSEFYKIKEKVYCLY